MDWQQYLIQLRRAKRSAIEMLESRKLVHSLNDVNVSMNDASAERIKIAEIDEILRTSKIAFEG